MPSSDLELRAVRITDPDAVTLIAQVQAEYVARYGSEDGTPIDPTMFDQPSGIFFVGYVEGEPVAMGGWKRRSDVAAFGRSTPAEIKRMFVVPAARGKGLARAVLAHLEGTARAAGADLMVLETGILQPEAIAMYESSGYTRINGFGHYAGDELARHYGKQL